MKHLVLLILALAAALNVWADNETTMLVEDFSIKPGEQKELAICLNNPSDTTFIQWVGNIMLPKGLEFVKAYSRGRRYAELDPDRCGELNIFKEGIATVGDKNGSLGVIINGQGTIEGHEGAIFYITVKASDSLQACGLIRVFNVQVTDKDYGPTHYPPTFYAAATTPKPLADVVEEGIEDRPCEVSEELTAVQVSKDGTTLWAKDSNAWAKNAAWPYAPTQEQIDGPHLYDKAADFDQSNWVAITLPTALSSADVAKYIGHKISGVSGKLTSKLNPAITMTTMPTAGEASSYTLNTYCVANFVPQERTFFMRPKPQEVANVRWAVYKDGAFYVPAETKKGVADPYEGAVTAKTDYYEGTTELTNNQLYLLKGVMEALPQAPSKAESVDPKDSPLSTLFNLQVIDAQTSGTVTSIDDVTSGKNVVDVLYCNPAGLVSAKPFRGINMVVTTYADGSRSVTKTVVK